MDKDADRPAVDTGSEHGERARSPSTDRLVNRLAELREQLEIVAPEDQDRGREALERIREIQERAATLDALLASARETEHDLTVQLVRDRTRIAEYEDRISELSVIAARASSAEEARRGAETTATEMERALTLTQADLAALRTEAEALRSRCSDLEADLSAVADEMAAATIARTEAARLRRERDESRDRARSERDLAAADRLRAAEAELRATELEGQLRSAERRIVQLRTATHQERSTRSPEVEEPPVPAPPPWIELQRENAELATAAAPEAEAQPSIQASQASLETMAEAPDPQRGKHEQTRIIDLTQGDEARPDQGERIGQADPGEEDAARSTSTDER
jgi:chromosome segregation ATPase